MEQKPPFDKTQVSGVSVNDVNYIPADGKEYYVPTDTKLGDEDMEPDMDLDLDLECEPEEMDIGCGEPFRRCADKCEEISLRPCEEFKDVTLHNVRMYSEGRIIKVKVQLCDVCRGRRIRLAVMLYEKECFEKRLCGLKVAEVTVPGMHGCKRKLTIGDFCFVLTEDNICTSDREISIQVIAHYASFPQDTPPC